MGFTKKEKEIPEDDLMNQELSHGLIKKYDNGTTLWFGAITDETDGFILRKSNTPIFSVFSEKRATYMMDMDDPNIIAIYGPNQKSKKED